jgi:ribosomal protein L37AE/L43A
MEKRKERWVLDPCEECGVGHAIKVLNGRWLCRKCHRKLKKLMRKDK